MISVDFFRHKSNTAGIIVNLADNVLVNLHVVLKTDLCDESEAALSIHLVIGTSLEQHVVDALGVLTIHIAHLNDSLGLFEERSQNDFAKACNLVLCQAF